MRLIVLICLCFACTAPTNVDTTVKEQPERNPHLIGTWYNDRDTLYINADGSFRRPQKTEIGTWESHYDMIYVNTERHDSYSGFWRRGNDYLTIAWSSPSHSAVFATKRYAK